MNILKKLTITNLKLNKKRTIVTIIGIMLSVALITAVSSIYLSFISSLINFEKYEKGDFHVVFYDVPLDKINNLKNNRKIEETYLTQNIGYAKLQDSKNKDKPYAFVKAFTTESLKNLSIKLTEGRLPEKDDEIVIPTHLKTNGRVELKVGDTITLNVGTRVSEGNELTQQNEYSGDNLEEIINTTPKTYKIVGVIERPATNIENYSAPGYTFITFVDEKNILNKADIYCKYTKEGSKDYINVTANILGVSGEVLKKIESPNALQTNEADKYIQEMQKAKYNYNLNSYLIDLETNPLNNNSVGELGTVVAIVCGIIVFTSVFCIKNSFDISISEKIKQYGMLKSIGATKKQIKKNVFFEASILGALGIPLGLLSGIIASFILIIISNYFLGDMLARGLKLTISFSWISFAVAIGLGIITIYLSALKSARKASKISPIESIRNSGEIKIKSKKIRTPKLIKRIFGIGGEISYKNLKRNKRKYRTTVISITVSVFVFIALSYFMNLAFEEIKNEIKLKDYNISLLADTQDDEQLYKKIIETTKLDNIKSYTISKYSNCQIVNPQYTKEYKDFHSDESDDDNGYFDGNINVRTLNNEQYKKYVEQLGLDHDEMTNKVILVDKQTASKYDKEKGKYIIKNIKRFDYKKNDKINCKTENDTRFELSIGIITNVIPKEFEANADYFLIINEETFEKYFDMNTVTICYDSSNVNKLQDDIDEMLNGYSYNINNIEENANTMRKLFTLVGIFLYGFIIVITSIGITNIFNTITTNMELRKPEFAMLKSIGMTTKEFNKMIRLETIFMGIKSLVFSIPIGIGLSYVIYKAFSGEQETLKFIVPINAIVTACLAVFLLITCIMKYSMNKINKQNTIETIRNENI